MKPMDEHLWRVRRWAEADEQDREDEADAACRAVFAEVSSEPLVPATFTASALAAIAADREAERRRRIRVRRLTAASGMAVTAASLYFGGAWLAAALWHGFIGGIGLLVGITVRVAMGVQAGADIWTLLANMGRATAALVADPKITIAMLAMQAVAMAALVALRRLLGSDRESLE